jgi:hypothetical protein
MKRLARLCLLVSTCLGGLSCFEDLRLAELDGGASDDALATGGAMDGAKAMNGALTDGAPRSDIDIPSSVDGSAMDSVFQGGDAGCSEGALRCAPAGTMVESCRDGIWSAKESCDAVCSNGVCTGTCRAGDKRCGTDNTPETCTAAGLWTPAAQPCPYVCSGQGVCGGGCKPESKRCGSADKLTPETCDASGKWIASTPCSNVCSSGSCGGSCVPGRRQCGANETPETCSPQGTWEPEPRCMFLCMGQGMCSGECRPGTKRCSGMGVLTPQTCDGDGHWVTATPCPYVCGSGVCGGVCSPGARQCGSNQIPQICDASGLWSDLTKCPFVCSGQGTCSGECSPGKMQCGSNQTPQTCNSVGYWENGQKCSFVCMGNGVCGGECNSGSRQCSGAGNNTPQTCVDGFWQGTTPCGASMICVGGSCSAACEANVDCRDGIGPCRKGLTTCATPTSKPICVDAGADDPRGGCTKGNICKGGGCVVDPCAPGSTENLVPNGGFDSAIWGPPDGTPGTEGEWNSLDARGCASSGSLYVRTPLATPSSPRVCVRVQPSTAYHFGFMVNKTSATAVARCYLVEWFSDGNCQDNWDFGSDIASPAKSGWQEVETMVTIPAGVHSGTLECSVDFNSAPAFFDRVFLRLSSGGF